MRHIKTLLLIITVVFTTCSLYAQEVTLDITKKGLRKIPVAIDSNLPRKLSNTLTSDLQLCDYFTITAVKSNADFILKCRKSGNIVITGKLYETKTNRMLLGKKFSGSQAQADNLVHALVDSIVTAVTGESGIAQTKLSFEHKQQLFISDYNGNHPKQITKDKCLNLFPNISPAGKKIVYTSYLYGYPQAFILDLAAGKHKRICSYPGLNASASFSPNGRKIALTLSKDGNPEIYTVNTSGSGLRRITKDRAVDTSPCWSPDGTKISFVSDRTGSPQIYTVNSRGGRPRRITYGSYYNTNPSWSSKGNIIVYNSSINRKFQICTIDLNTGETQQITSDRYKDSENPSFAPDGRHIAFTRTNGYNKTIYIMDIYYREPHRINIGKGSFSNPDWGN